MSRSNQTRDDQALNFGIQSAASSSQLAPQEANTLGALAAGPPPTATLGTSHVANGPNDLAGQIIISTSNSAVWASANVIYATILSNTAANPSVVTVDDWKTLSTNASGQTPAASALYVVLPASMPFKVIGLTDSVAAVSGSETGTAPGGNELTANGLGRTVATTTSHSAGASTGTLGVTFTYTGGVGVTVGRSFISNSFTAAASAGRGNFLFFVDQLNGSVGYQVANSGDSIAITYTITFTAVP